MANVLEKIVLDKKQEIAQRKIDLPLASFIDDLTLSDRITLNQQCQGGFSL